MEGNLILVLILSAVICLCILVLKFFIYNPDTDFPDVIATLLTTLDIFKDILFVAYVLYFMLYGVALC